MSRPPLTHEEADALYSVALDILDRMEERNVEARKPSSPMPAGMFKSRQGWLVVNALLALIAYNYPEVTTDGVAVDIALLHLHLEDVN